NRRKWAFMAKKMKAKKAKTKPIARRGKDVVLERYGSYSPTAQSVARGPPAPQARAGALDKIPSALSRAPKRQRKLLRHRRPMALDEVFQSWRDLSVPFGKPFCQFVGDVIRHVARPALGGVEGNHSDGIAILARH